MVDLERLRLIADELAHSEAGSPLTEATASLGSAKVQFAEFTGERAFHDLLHHIAEGLEFDPDTDDFLEALNGMDAALSLGIVIGHRYAQMGGEL